MFGHRLRQAGLLESIGRVASSVDNTMIESFWSTIWFSESCPIPRRWDSREQLVSAIFEWTEPSVPKEWHGMQGNGQGSLVHVRY